MQFESIWDAISNFSKKTQSVVLISPSVSGHNDVCISKKSSSNIFQPTRSPHPRWLQKCPPSAPITLEVLEERLTSEASSENFQAFTARGSPDASKEVCKSDCSWGFFSTTVTDKDKNLGKWSELLVTYETRCSNNITCAMPKAVLLSVGASPLEGVPLPALVPFLVGLP